MIFILIRHVADDFPGMNTSSYFVTISCSSFNFLKKLL
jgi:hypothetical protein